MTDINFVVKKVYPGTENQRKAGIYATFGIDVVVDNVTVVSLADYKLCKNKQGETYVQSPYREYEKKGAEPGAKQKIYFAKLFPEDRDGLQVQGIIEQVKRACEGGHTAPARPSSNTATARPEFKPNGYTKPAAKPNVTEGW
jgi:hypothetical protein